jgi:hypothetical protein
VRRRLRLDERIVRLRVAVAVLDGLARLLQDRLLGRLVVLRPRLDLLGLQLEDDQLVLQPLRLEPELLLLAAAPLPQLVQLRAQVLGLQLGSIR